MMYWFCAITDWINVDLALAYLAIGLFTLLLFIRKWIADHGYDGLDEALGKMALWSLIGWPCVTVVWVGSWSVFTWRFWLRPVGIKWLTLPAFWWVK